MILRIADENAVAERVPWLTLGLAVIVLACFFLARSQASVGSDGALVDVEQAVGYWLERPYLEPEPEIAAAAAAAAGAADTAAFVESTRERGAIPPPDPEAFGQEQSGLAYLTRVALRGTDSNPGPAHAFRRFGLARSAFRAHALLTHAFLHSGWVHLALSLLLLALVGPALESRIGTPIYAGLCLVTGLAAALAHLALAGNSTAPLVGSLGITSGLLGAFAVRFGAGRLRLRTFTLQGLRPIAVSHDVSPVVLIPLAIALQLTLSLLFRDRGVVAGSDWLANLIGLACGGAIAFALQHFQLEKRWAARALEARARAQLDPRLKRALTARERGQHDEAIELAAAVLRERPDDIDALQASWNAHVAAGRAGDGARSARRLVELQARRGDLASSARIWDELLRVAHRSPVAPTTLLRIVPELVVQARRDAAIAALRAVVDPANTALTVGQAMRVAELGAELDPPTALRAARFALAGDDLVEERRARLEQLVQSLENAGVAPKTGPASETAIPPAAESVKPDAVSEALAEIEIPEDLALPDEYSKQSVEPPAPPAELFELEPTQLSVEAPALAPVVAAPPAAHEENYATVIFDAPDTSAANAPNVKITPAQPVALDVAGLRVRLEGGAPSLIEWTRIQAIGVGLVSGLGPNPLVVIDLVLNWADVPEGELEVIRLRSDGFRARQLVTGAENALDALRALLAELLARSGAVPLPDASGAHGLPFREFASPEAYRVGVLLP